MLAPHLLQKGAPIDGAPHLLQNLAAGEFALAATGTGGGSGTKVSGKTGGGPVWTGVDSNAGGSAGAGSGRETGWGGGG